MSFDARLTVIGKHVGYDTETITIDNTVGGKGLTASKLTTPPRPKRVFITTEGGQMRYYYDGTAPTSSTGHILNPIINTLMIEGIKNLEQFRAIRTGTTSGKLVVSYER